MEVDIAWTTTETPSFDHILQALQQLDRRLEHALIAARSAYGPEAAADPYRGLHISDEEVEQLISREPGALVLQHPDGMIASELVDLQTVEWPFAHLQERFDLTPFDLDVLLIALAPELDLRYERLYAYLQDDVTRKRPSVDLVLGSLSSVTSSSQRCVWMPYR